MTAMPGRFRRFLHLERARAPGPPAPPGAAPPARDAEAGRFDAVEERAAPGAARPATGADVERFERFAPAPGAQAALELEARASGARPFTRCERCEVDHAVHAEVCSRCGGRLDTPAQQAFNERLWAARRAEAAREEAAAAALRAEQARAQEEEARARRALAEQLAREVGDRERRRLGGAGAGGDAALGVLLLRALPAPRWRVAAACAAGAAVLGLVGGGLASGSPGAVLSGLVLGIALGVPRRGARRGR
jgi:hypothetical protein